MPAYFYNDSAFTTNYGTDFLPISGNGVTGLFLAENISINQPSTAIEIRGRYNEPQGRIVTADYEAGTATLQVSGNMPVIGARFGFQGSVYYLDSVGKTYAQSDIYKASVNFAKVYNV